MLRPLPFTINLHFSIISWQCSGSQVDRQTAYLLESAPKFGDFLMIWRVAIQFLDRHRALVIVDEVDTLCGSITKEQVGILTMAFWVIGDIFYIARKRGG